MVLPFLLSAVGGIASSGIGTAINPVMEIANQELSKLIPVRKAQVSSIIKLRYREEIDIVTFYERMARYGYDKLEADREMKASEYFPSPSEQIRLAVREADREDIAEQFETDLNFDKLPLAEFAKSGIDETQLKRAWRAHWDLPSSQQGFEMFHRLSADQLKFKTEDLKFLGFTEEQVETSLDTLKTLLQTNDMMAYWARRMQLIAYNPVGRIDIRRFEDFDIIDDDKLIFMNREIGYSPDSAAQLALWTKLANALTDLKPALQSGLISFDEAIASLVEEGATPAQARKLVMRRAKTTKKLRAQKFVDKAIDEILKSFINNTLDGDEAKDGLMALGKTDEEANSELALAIVAAGGDFEDGDQLQVTINAIRESSGLPLKQLRVRNVKVIVFEYTVELEDEEKTHIDLRLAENHQIGDRILDTLNTGKYGRIIRKVGIKGATE